MGDRNKRMLELLGINIYTSNKKKHEVIKKKQENETIPCSEQKQIKKLYEKNEPAAKSYMDVREYFNQDKNKKNQENETITCSGGNEVTQTYKQNYETATTYDDSEREYLGLQSINASLDRSINTIENSTTLDIVPDSDSTFSEHSDLCNRRFPHITISESDLSTSSKEIEKIPNIRINRSDIPVLQQNTNYLDESFEEPYQDSGSEYIPDSEQSSYDSVSKNISKRKEKKPAEGKSAPPSKEDKHGYKESNLDEYIPVHKEVTPMNVSLNAEQNSQISSNNCNVMHKKNPRKRTHDKKHACMYCNKLFSKLPRHLESAHSNEAEVAQFTAIPKNSKERYVLIEMIRQKGNFVHNTEAINTGKGEVIPKRRPTDTSKRVDDFTVCNICYGCFDKKYFYSHKRTCTSRQTTGKNVQQKIIRKTSFPVGNVSEGFRSNVIDKMRQDELYHIIRADALILEFGSELFNRLGTMPHLHAYISQKMRQLARLLAELRKINKEIQTLTDAINPKYYKDFIMAVQSVANFNQETCQYGTPSLALRLRTSVRQCADIYKSDQIIKGCSTAKEKIEDFVSLIEMNFKSQVSTHALTTQYKNKWNKSEILPLASDVSVLTDYLKKKASVLYNQLTNEINSTTWILLCEITLIQTLLFNRRRSGEVERVHLATYEHRDLTPLSEDVLNTMTAVEKTLTQELTRFEVRGKKGRKVPILLLPEVKNQIDLLNKTRTAAGIEPENPYLFPTINSIGHMRSGEKLKEFVTKSGCKDPHSITSTKLRKQVATASQLLNLKDNEMDQLATYMGHDIRIHREYYRLPDSATQITKISKLLLAMDKGNLNMNKNKNFDNIEFNVRREMSVPDEMYKENIPEEFEAMEVMQEDTTEMVENMGEVDLGQYSEHSVNNIGSENVIPTKKKARVPKKTNKPKRCTKKRPWSSSEKDAMNRQMAIFWIRKKVPNKKDCEKCLASEPELKDRSWRDLKYYVHNVIQKDVKQTR